MEEGTGNIDYKKFKSESGGKALSDQSCRCTCESGAGANAVAAALPE